MNKVVVVDYGVGNLKSVARGFKAVGAEVTLSSDECTILNAERIVLPGVGAFKEGMAELAKRNLIEPLQEFARKGRPLLGICLGMQFLLTESEEHGKNDGLAVIKGKVKALPKEDETENVIRKIPHIGWSCLENTQYQDFAGSVLEKVDLKDSFYFVHSYHSVPEDEKDVLAACEYQGLKINAAIKKDSVTGLQFHPEKSGEAGLKILKEFLES